MKEGLASTFSSETFFAPRVSAHLVYQLKNESPSNQYSATRLLKQLFT